MKTFLRMVQSNYLSWIKNDKQIITVFLFICLYVYTIQPFMEYSAGFNEPVNFVEAYMIFIGNGYVIPLLVLTFLVLMIDFPDISGNAAFLLIRTGRKRWYDVQTVSVICMAASFLVSLVVFSVVLVIKDAYIADAWSNSVRMIHLERNQDLKINNLMAVLDMSIIHNFTPYKAMLEGSILILLYLMFAVQFQMVLSLKYNKMVGICVNLIILGMGLALWSVDNPAKWIFPLANSTIGWHYGEVLNETRCPMIVSFLYMIGINVITYFTGLKIMRKKALTLLSQGE